MRKKSFLAKVLAVAVAVTSILPSGGLMVQAAPQVKTIEESRWLHTDEEGTFNLAQDQWLNAETNEEFEFGPTVVLGDGISTWRLTSSLEDGNKSMDLSVGAEQEPNAGNRARACVYAKGIDITAQDNGRRVMQFVVYPQEDYALNAIRFGIMLKYVDATHWAFLGYNGQAWWIQRQNGENQDLYTNNLITKKMNKDEHFRITLTYETNNKIKIRMAVCEEQNVDGEIKLVEKAETVLEQDVEQEIFETLKTYATTHNLPIHMGFVAGTDHISASLADAARLTTINIENVMVGTLKNAEEGGEAPKAESENAEDWVEPLELIAYEDCKWVSPKGVDPEDILIQQVIGDADTYAAMGNVSDPDKRGPNATIYNKTVTDFEEGEISAVLRPYTVGANKEYYLGLATVTSDPNALSGDAEKANSSFKIGIKNNKWGYILNGGEFQELGSQPSIKATTDYNVIMKVDGQGKVTADVEYEAKVSGSEATEMRTVTLLDDTSEVNVKGLSGAVSLTALGEAMRVREVVCKKATCGKSALEEKYEELKDKNADYTYYNDIWAAFATEDGGALKAAEDALNANDNVITPGDAAYADFNEEKARELQEAFEAIDVDANKVATGKAQLQEAYDAVKDADLTSAEYTDYYTSESIAAFGDNRNAAKDLLDSFDGQDYKGIDNVSVFTDAISKINKMTALQAISYSKNDAKTQLENALNAVLKDSEGNNIYDESKGDDYYENWSDFADALAEVRRLKGIADSEDDTTEISKIDVKNAIDALNDAAAEVTAKKVTDLTAISDEIAQKHDKYVTTDYYNNDAQWTRYQAALTAVQTINANTDLKDADEKMAEFRTAFADLHVKQAEESDKTALTTSITGIEGEVAQKVYEQDTEWTAYETALQAAKAAAASETATKRELAEALEELMAAKAKLHEHVYTKADAVKELNDALDAVLKDADGNDKYDEDKGDDYYENWSDFATALAAVRNLKNAASITEDDVDDAITTLNTAANALSLKKVTETALETIATEIAQTIDEKYVTTDYYEEDVAWTQYQKALADAKNISSDASLKEAEEKLDALKKAYGALKVKDAAESDKTGLASSIAGIESAVGSVTYKKDDAWTVYEAALQAAKDAAASATSKRELAEALAKLQAAQGALNKAEPSDTQKPPETKPPVTKPPVTKPPVTPVTPAGPKKGDVKKVGNATYTIEDPAAATVTLKTGDKKIKKAVKVDKVTIEGKSYTVVGIGANAFKNGKMTSITIGASVTTIGKNAFANCKRVKSVTIGKKVKSIASGAFSKCSKLTTVTFKGTAVKTIAKNSFKGSKVKKVKVPKKLKKDKKFLKKVKSAGMKVNKLS